MAKTAILATEGPIATIRFSFDRELNYTLKRRRIGARWDPERGCWVAPRHTLESVVEALRELEYDFVVVPEHQVDSWAQSLHDALPPDLLRPTYVALSRVLHPDTGGDHHLMQTLNLAWDEDR